MMWLIGLGALAVGGMIGWLLGGGTLAAGLRTRRS